MGNPCSLGWKVSGAEAARYSGRTPTQSDRHAVQHRGTFQPPDEQRIRLSSGLKRKSCTKRRMRRCSEKSHARDPTAVTAAIRRGKNFQTRCWRDPALPRRARKPHLECVAAIGLLLRVRHRNPC
jgi:hypothetical protein